MLLPRRKPAERMVRKEGLPADTASLSLKPRRIHLQNPLDLSMGETQYHLVALEVPYEQRAEASARGAVWIGHKKVWACAPDRSIEFSQWISGEPLIFDLMSD